MNTSEYGIEERRTALLTRPDRLGCWRRPELDRRVCGGQLREMSFSPVLLTRACPNARTQACHLGQIVLVNGDVIISYRNSDPFDSLSG